MKRKKYLAIVAVIVFGGAGLAFAQKDSRATQAAQPAAQSVAQPAAQSDGSAPMVACACSHMDSGVMACSRATAPDVAKEKHAYHAKDKGASTIWDKGDPTAPQNRIEYGGGG